MLLEGNYRMVVLVLGTACLSMMLANIITLNFTIICMTEEKFHWENFTIDLGLDVFDDVKFEFPDDIPDLPSLPDAPTTKKPSFLPDFSLPGIDIDSSFGFNWQTFDLAKHNPELFGKILKKVMVEVGERTAMHIGEKLDPRNIDFQKLKNGFNLTSFNVETINNLKSYMLEKLRTLDDIQKMDVGGRNVSDWEKVRIEDIELKDITWKGVIHGRVKVLDKPADHYYSSTERSTLFGAIAVGALVAIFPFSSCVHRLGTRKSFTIVMLISTVSTALCPTAAALGFVPFVVARAFQGIGFAACMPVIGSITASWAALTENGLFSGALTSFIQLAPVITMPMSGVLCVSDFGWAAVFYVHAGITAVLTVFWWTMYRDTPHDSKCVTLKETRHIQEGKVIDGRSRHTKHRVPLKAIYSSISVWAVWIAAIGNMYAIQMVVVFSPTYISQVLGYPIVNVGIAAALPTLLQFIVKMIAGITSDKITFLSETAKVRIFNSVAFMGMGGFMVLLAIAPDSTPFLSLCLLIACAAVLGFNTGGFFKSATLVGRHYSQIVNAHVQFIMCLAMLTVPYIVYGLTPTNSHSEWAIVFIVHASLLFLTNAFFFFFGEGVAAPFARSPTEAKVAPSDV
ncbi:hypothetical protein QR680_009901 [Steinernema hermaphroditum]|uniref:Major facilitator superfamily (MFS) profile domain-containing protein n=1 Tax=Steinernema hermaphroditum TaxID=289476 RepID=A0AA39IM12_9BILA|nr:hypothetical protein QR680_009901 [Steinernema hermaphroditum]